MEQSTGYTRTERRTILPRSSPPPPLSIAAQGDTVSTPCKKTWELDLKNYRSNRNAPNLLEGKRRRNQVSSACERCQKRRIKCDGLRPTCAPCSARHLDCKFNVPVGVSRNQNLKHQVHDLSGQLDVLERFVEILARGTDFDASAALSCLRVGQPIEEIVRDASRGQSPSPTSMRNLFESLMDGPNESNELFGEREQEDVLMAESLASPTPPQGLAAQQMPYSDSDQSIPPYYRCRDSTTGSSASQSTHQPSPINSPSPTLTPPKPYPTSPIYKRTLEQTPWPLPGGYRPFEQVPGSNTAEYVRLGTDALNLGNNVYQGIYSAIPMWAILPAMAVSGDFCTHTSIKSLCEEAERLRLSGYTLHHITGAQPNISAMFNEEQLSQAPLVSRWATLMTRRLKPTGTDFTVLALLHLAWHMGCWLVNCCRETYECIPNWLRPTPNQLLIHHTELFDILMWPALRDYVISSPAMHTNLEWFEDLKNTLKCAWPGTPQEAVYMSDQTGKINLTDAAKACIYDLDNWTLGARFRKHLLNADAYVKIHQGSLHGRE